MKRLIFLGMLLLPLVVGGQGFTFLDPTFKCAAPSGGGPPPSTPWLTVNSAPPDAGNGGTYTKGVSFVVGAANVIVTHLGMYVFSGSTQTHTLKIYDNGCSVIASVSLDATGLGAGIQYAALGSPVTMTAGQTYYVTMTTFDGGDHIADLVDANGATYSKTAVVSSISGVYAAGDACPTTGAFAGYISGGASFKYSSP